MRLKKILSGLWWGIGCWISIPPVKYLFTHNWDPSYYSWVTLAVWIVGGVTFELMRRKILSLVQKKQ